jgi:hypothetical protein
VLNTIVAGSIKLEDIQRTLFGKRLTALALATGITIRSRIGTVDDLGKNSRTGSLTHTTRTTEEIRMSKFSTCHGILQRSGESLLSYDSIK